MNSAETETILGIDLGTTNSEVAVFRDGAPVVLGDNGDLILPSVVGLDTEGKLLVGRPARNQSVLAPERTIRSIKRKMGQDVTVDLGDRKYTPQEISAIILRTLKERAERSLGQQVRKAVITVPAYFTDLQREATREAGDLAGLEVVRIINEPTAAALTYDPVPDQMERLLVYDLGGGTFDVSIVQIEQGVVEVLASHGDTQLGGDDFDQKLLDHVAEKFKTDHGIDLRDSAVGRSRLLHAVEQAKITLSSEPFAIIEEEFIAEKDGVPLHLKMEIARPEYEDMIEPFLHRTLECVDKTLSDAGLPVNRIDKVVLVGGMTRTPMIQRLLEDRMGQPVHAEVEPDLCVAMGAAIQGGMIAGLDVGPVLVDITPHTLGIQVLGELNGYHSGDVFSPIINRNTALPVKRSELYYTNHDEQHTVLISVYQGENADVRYNTKIGEVTIEGLAPVKAGNEIQVRFELDLNGILRVTATERATGLAKQATIDNAMERFRASGREDARQRLADAFATGEPVEDAQVVPVADALDEESRQVRADAERLIAKCKRLFDNIHPDDVEDLKQRLEELNQSLDDPELAGVTEKLALLEDVLFYLEDA